MISISYDDLAFIGKYYDFKPCVDVVESLVDELASVLEDCTGLDVCVYQDFDDDLFFRVYAGCSAVEVYVLDGVLCVDFDDTWMLSSRSVGCTSLSVSKT